MTDNNIYLDFTVRQERTMRTDSNRIASGTRNTVRARFTLLDDWLGITPIAVFTKGNTCMRILTVNGECGVPNSMIEKEGQFSVCVYGGDFKTTTTEKAYVAVVKGGYDEHSEWKEDDDTNILTYVETVEKKIKYIREGENGVYEYSSDGSEWRSIDSSWFPIVSEDGTITWERSQSVTPPLPQKIIPDGTKEQYYRGDKKWAELDKAAVGLDNVDNTSDEEKPLSKAQQAAIDELSEVSRSGSYDDLLDIPENIVTDADYVHTDNNYTDVDREKVANAVQRESGKGLSTENYTTEEKEKVAKIETSISEVKKEISEKYDPLIPEQATKGNQLATESFVNSNVERIETKIELKADISALNIETQARIGADNDLSVLIDEARVIAEGRIRAKVFANVQEMEEWLGVPANAATLNIGDNLFILDVDVPDFWWTGTEARVLETEKVDLTDYYTGEQINLLLASKVSISDFNIALGLKTDLSVFNEHKDDKSNPHEVVAEQVKFSDGETFQEKYDGGKLNGTDGKNATINGLQAIEIVDGANTTVKIADSKMKIDAAKTAVVDNLTSTSSADALSASQGRVLNEKTTAMPTTQPNFSEANATIAAFTDNLAETATLGTGWAGTMPAFTHASGSTGVLSFPVSIANGDFIEIAFTQTGTATDNTFSIVLAANSTAASGQTVKAGVFYNTTFVIQATGNYGYVNIVPAGTWAGAFTLTHIKKAVSLNSHSVSVKSFPKIVRNATVAEGGGGKATTSGNNIALGSDALFFNTSGNYNTAIGNNTLRSNTTGICNNAFGSQSLLNNTSGTYNVGLGTQTLERNISGSNNMGIGHYALSSNVTGGNNVGIGTLALTGNIVGNNNVGIGYSCLYNLTGGSFNVGIGSHAGNFLSNGSTAQTNASNSLFIGYNSKGASSDSQTNQIVIGYNAAGNGSNTITLGNSSITKLLCQVTEISALSDSRVKDDQGLANLEMCYDAVRSLPVHRYRYKAFTGRHLDTNVTGFMADDVERIFPKAVQKSNQYFPVLDENGGAVYEEIAETATEIDAEGNEVQVEKTRRAEKMFLMEDVKDITMTEALPTLWGAVQALMEKVEKLEEKLA